MQRKCLTKQLRRYSKNVRTPKENDGTGGFSLANWMDTQLPSTANPHLTSLVLAKHQADTKQNKYWELVAYSTAVSYFVLLLDPFHANVMDIPVVFRENHLHDLCIELDPANHQ